MRRKHVATDKVSIKCTLKIHGGIIKRKTADTNEKTERSIIDRAMKNG